MNAQDIRLLCAYDRWANNDESLQRGLTVRGAEFRLAELIQHLVNHSTYHRGQVTMMLRLLGATPLPTDFPLFLLESRSETATPQ
jgi:uncharacterized damage-inducible protein DinB